MRRILVFFLLLLSFAACSGDTENIGVVRQPIINGDATAHAQVPSIVALTNTDGVPFCTGTLIKSDLVLTAAHCVDFKSADEVKVSYGNFRPAAAEEDCFYNVNSIELHPDYLVNSFDGGRWDDIALLGLAEQVDNPVTVSILEEQYYDEFLPHGGKVLIAGYGQRENGIPSGDLYSAEVEIYARLAYEIVVGEPGPGQPDACFGDSGGPIYVDVDGETYVTGVTSRAFQSTKCGDGTVYALPGPYLNWIENTYATMTKPVKIRSDFCRGIEPEPPVVVQPTGGCMMAEGDENSWLFLLIIGAFLAVRRSKS